MLGWGFLARYRRARRRRIEAQRTIGARLATWGTLREPGRVGAGPKY